MRLPGFFGGTDQVRSYRANVERTVNLVPERIESGNGENDGWMGRRPGLNIYAQGSGAQGETIYHEPVTGRTFLVAGTDLLEVTGPNAITDRGNVAASTAAVPPMIVGNGVGGQLLITSGGVVYNYELSTNTLTTIANTDVVADVVQCLFTDGYFLVLSSDGTLQWSVLADFVAKVPVTWDPLDVAQRSTMADPWIGMTLLHREVRLFGSDSAEAWIDTGDALQPFQLVQGSVNEVGTASISSLAIIGNTVMFVGRNVQGFGIVWRAGGYIPERVSNHSVEAALAQSGDIAASRAMVIQQAGHTFYLLRIPDLDQTWVYDLASGLWTNWAILVDDTTEPWTWEPWPGVSTTFAFGRQLIVGETNGYTVGTLDDTGSFSRELLGVSTDLADLLVYDWSGALRRTVTLTGTEGTGASAATLPASDTQAFAMIRGGANLDIYAGASLTVPSATAIVGSTGSGPQCVRTVTSGTGTTTVTVTYLVGGSGGGSGPTTAGGLTGGGGAGAVLQGSTVIGAGAYPVVVGLGGLVGVNGSLSSWNGVSAPGGGRGGAESEAGQSGGSGGGAGNAAFVGSGGDLGNSNDWQSYPGGTGTNGYNGGRDHINAAGGGGGAASVGSAATQNNGGNGGNPVSSSISGAAVNYGAGGAGQGLTAPGTAPSSSYCGGGTNSAGQNGVVVLRYPTADYTATGGTITTDGADTVHTFTSSGTFAVTVAPTVDASWAVAQVADSIPAGSLAFLDDVSNLRRFYNPDTGVLLGYGYMSSVTNLTPVSILANGNLLSGTTLWANDGSSIAAPITASYSGRIFSPPAGSLYASKSVLNAGNYETTAAMLTSLGVVNVTKVLPDAIDDSGGHLDYLLSTGTMTTDGATLYHVGRDRRSQVKVTAGNVGVAASDASGIWRIRTLTWATGAAGTDLYNSGATANTEQPIQLFTLPDNTIISLWRNGSGGRLRQHNTSGAVLQNHAIPTYTGVELVFSGWPGATSSTVWIKFANGLTTYVGELDLATGAFLTLFTEASFTSNDVGYLTTVDL